MRKIEKSKGWEATLHKWKQQLASLNSGQDGTELEAKIVSLEKAISMRDSLSAQKSPKGTIEFSL